MCKKLSESRSFLIRGRSFFYPPANFFLPVQLKLSWDGCSCRYETRDIREEVICIGHGLCGRSLTGLIFIEHGLCGVE